MLFKRNEVVIQYSTFREEVNGSEFKMNGSLVTVRHMPTQCAVTVFNQEKTVARKVAMEKLKEIVEMVGTPPRMTLT